MSGPGRAPNGSAASVMREIDQELERLRRYEHALARERQLLLSARAALSGTASSVSQARRRRLSRDEVADYLAEHPGSSPAQIAEALQVPTTNVSTHLYRGRHTRYERHEDGWHVRSSSEHSG
jgi:DNA-directed RNA polymerase specialized sigma24 family protein